ncbi:MULTISPECIES: GntR family transcriptional regulator [Roseobacteraceae]|uniref:Transcriptional regulator protein n=1 Tax=Celeribacter baekdonensis B30 TaxID=1208323 RepID=K2INM2_9RHOB|nr:MULTISPECIES: GntR family transcriptional regulator [Roseobacteraceae]EKE71736.1 transcriptional regulator protein [Celeribacter baekdonensis B30]|tara:strand:- start:18403 stop:19056 length:654 start_codon:yes stop_codon:yes gene_type:complete
MTAEAPSLIDHMPDDVTERLRSDIVLGALRPGEWLRQIDLQDRYNCTRSAARTALATLANAHIVEHTPNRGFRVVLPSIEARVEITDVRLMLELPAAAEVVANASDADIADIRAAALAFDAGVDVLPFQQMRGLNHAFHRALVAPLQNSTLASLIHELRERDLPGDWSNWATTAKVRQSSLDHLHMVDAIETGDARALQDIIEVHLTRWQTLDADQD